ncbi:50S ribosomal protein L30 [Neolewinella antarctica]|uniref:Large ribosomal subunit protein uL30 n=1 Tax=Neolewinella antarctica TaxID=442734 RepID=A0ABX0X940_9BACT|nr:50S ribosomal protein L30 [Neolewinella antarctica]NJC25474.1 large subunit ribosomal protein L30 [Neolewinella antarctica]
MAKVKITQVKSVIDRPKKQKATMMALGFKRMHQTIEREDTPVVMGMVKAVSHLVKVEEA